MTGVQTCALPILYIMAGLLIVGFIANFLIQAVDDRHHMEAETVDDVVGVA